MISNIDLNKYQGIGGLKYHLHGTTIYVENMFGERLVGIELGLIDEKILGDTWHGFVTAEEYKTIMNGILIDTFVATGCTMKICNTQNLSIGMDGETSEWFRATFLRRLVNAGLQYNAIVLPKEQYAKRSMEYFERHLPQNHAMSFASFDIALLWLRAVSQPEYKL